MKEALDASGKISAHTLAPLLEMHNTMVLLLAPRPFLPQITRWPK